MMYHNTVVCSATQPLRSFTAVMLLHNMLKSHNERKTYKYREKTHGKQALGGDSRDWRVLFASRMAGGIVAKTIGLKGAVLEIVYSTRT